MFAPPAQPDRTAPHALLVRSLIPVELTASELHRLSARPAGEPR
jgi:hypothetical protein